MMNRPIPLIKRQSGGDGVSIPDVCFNICSNLLIIAQQTGKVPALCKPNSAFVVTYNACTTCIENYIENGAGSSVLKPLPVAQFVSYCHLGLTTSTGIFTLTNGEVSTIVYVVPATASASTTGSTSTSPTRSESPSPTRSTSSSAQRTSTAPISSSTTSPVISSSSTTSKAWIAGPVIGSIAVIALILGLLFYIRKRGRKTTIAHNESGSPYEKAELHADDVLKPVYEAGAHDIHEVEGSSPYPPAEKPANETPAFELASIEARREGNSRDDKPN